MPDASAGGATIREEREAAVAATLDRVKAIERDRGVTRPALEEVMREMLRLAAREELFPAADFPAPPEGEGGARRTLLAEDPDNRFALYINALNPGNETKPHDHTTWAVIVAVDGQELNRVYERLDDGTDPDRCAMRVREEVMVEPGRGIAFMPDDIHSIHTMGTAPTRHLHLYGLALERLDDRRAYDMESGAVIPYNRNFMRPTETSAGTTPV